jgi:hypothetical protein
MSTIFALFGHRWLRRYSGKEYAVIAVVSLVRRRDGDEVSEEQFHGIGFALLIKG